MANIFKAKSLISRTGVFSNEVIAPNLVYNTGDQNVSGIKSFYSRPTVNGTGVLLSGEAASLPTTIVYTTGNQTISGIKTFANNLEVQGTGIFNALDLSNISEFNFSGTNINLISGNVNISGQIYISGNPVLTGVDLSSYASAANLASTGNSLNNSITSLSGLFTGYTGNLDSTFASDIQLANTGSTLDTKIDNLSGYVTGANATFASITNLANTGSTLDTKINNLSGYVTGANATFASITNLANTGSTLDTKIDNLSGYVTGANATFASITNLANTGSTLDTKIDNLSGYVTGANATFASITNLANTGSTLDTKINNLSGYVTGANATFASITNLANTGSTLDTKIDNLSGYVTGANATFASITNLANTGSTLDTKINNLSGYVTGANATFASITNLANTGSTLNTKINNLSGYINSTSSNIVFTTGNQTISGVKTFAENATFGDTGQGDFLVISGNNFTVYGSGNFTSGLFVSGSPVLTGSSTLYATTANLALTGSTLNSNINSLSGLFTGFTGALDTTFASDIQLANTGSTLDTKINNLSGYVTGANATFASITNLANTGSTLNTNINNLSGYINSSSSNIVFTTGNQTINGNKSFYGDVLLSGSNNRIGQYHYIEVDGDFVFIRRQDHNLLFDSEESSLCDNNGIPSVQFGSRALSDGTYESINWSQRYLANQQNGTPVLTWTGDNIGIGTNTPTEKLHVSGNLKLDGSYIYIYDSSNDANNNIVWGDSELIFNNNYDGPDPSIVGFVFNNGPLGENVLYSNRPSALGTFLTIPSGKTDYIAVDSEVVHKIGNETISGVKAFDSRPTVNGTGVLLSGEAAPKDIATTINISSNTISLDLSAFSYFLVNLNSNITTANFNNPKAAPEVTSFVLQLSGDGTIRSVTWPTSLRWPGSTAPTITIGPNKVDTYSIFSYDGGVSYYGFPAGYNS